MSMGIPISVSVKQAIFSLFLFSLNVLPADSCAVTYALNGGRLGDNLVTYVRAKWIAFKHDLPFFYVPFNYSEQLMICQTEQSCSEEQEKYRKRIKILFEIDENASNTMFICDYDAINSDLYEYTIQYPEFAKEIKSKIRPIQPLSLIDLPSDKITVAVHVRKGGGYDLPLGSLQLYDPLSWVSITGLEKQLYVDKYSDYGYPSKFPPDQYYIEQIKKLSKLLNDAPLFVYIFTDDQNPYEIMNRYKQAVGKQNIEFCCRMDANAHNKNVLEDLFAMAKFDCLIRATSNFPWVAQIIGNHKIIIFPTQAEWRRDRVMIDAIKIILCNNDNKIFKQYEAYNQISQEDIALTLKGKL